MNFRSLPYKIPGLFIIDSFLDLAEEQELLSAIQPFENRGNKNDRNSVQRFGSFLPYQNSFVAKKIPSHFEYLIDRLNSIVPAFVENFPSPDSVSINEYLPGNQIAPHTDSPRSGPVICIVSLLGSCDFIIEGSGIKRTIEFPRRSLFILSGIIRDKWKHSVPPVKEQRYSIVFRKGTRI